MEQFLSTIDDLEARIGKTPNLAKLKTIDHLDEGALTWLAASPLMMASFGGKEGIGVTFGAAAPGWVSGNSAELQIPAAMIDDPDMARTGVSFGSFFMIPLINELLRVNGRVIGNDGEVIHIAVQECYLHCGKALLRSKFWQTGSAVQSPTTLDQVFDSARFLALGTIDANGYADISPKGDPARAMVQLDTDMLWFADRPGNKRIDSFRNIVSQPHVAAIVMIPGSPYVARLVGTARISDDPVIRTRFAVQEKVPALVTAISDLSVELMQSDALVRAASWIATPVPPDVEPARITLAHLKLNNNLEAQQAAAAMSEPGFVEQKMQEDYKKNLY
ncbi:pyridoxamine 5'-phosphate oxidase family protein [Billgrantia endophytica]|uniref:Pyridoxamine 5-phosphate oxidase n=1 Tax=Billgrantia endophytica TaxID=2033802 RepID=A0A2N7TZK5_9GAMM|nr:pyridoxamine 5'-phosphate oxidase family protein [Halomonas endophytica]PMR73619.1 pyridoxamine 5-phosphate oxidase [Halomonas endophytica]